MFSANENIQLRQHKRRIVTVVEECIPSHVLDMGVNVMAMQVTCQSPGCVPLETVIVIIFPSSTIELIPGFKESKGGSFKTKVLKPMSMVEKQDILEALPSEYFIGGLRSMEKLCILARDVMLVQITQLFDDTDTEGRQLMAEYLIDSLHQFINQQCIAPEWGRPFLAAVLPKEETRDCVRQEEQQTVVVTSAVAQEESTIIVQQNKREQPPVPIPLSSVVHAIEQHDKDDKEPKNIVIRRIMMDDDTTDLPGRLVVAVTDSTMLTSKTKNNAVIPGRGAANSSSTFNTTTPSVTNTISYVDSVTHRRQQQLVDRQLSLQESPLEKLARRDHAPGLRQPGCPCCDPDNPSNIVDQLLRL